MIKAVFFDFDGTLANSLSFHLETYRRALASCNISKSDREIAHLCFGKTIRNTCDDFGIPEQYEKFNGVYNDAVYTLSDSVLLFNDAIDMLTQLKKLPIHLAVISFAYKWYISKMRKIHNLDKYFDSYISQEDVINPKPHPESIFSLCQKYGILPEEVLMIGDSESDILMAKSAGSKSALIFPEDHTQFYDLNELKKTSPDYTIKSLSELLTIL